MMKTIAAFAVATIASTAVHNTNRLVRECMVGIGLRKKGITDPDYMSPLTVDICNSVMLG